MAIDVYEITSRKKKKQKSGLERFDHSLKNFKLHKTGQCSVDSFLNSPNISLYLFDFKKKYALFVEFDSSYELNHAPFFSDYQYEKAKKIFLVPLNVFHQLARRIGKLSTTISLMAFTARSGSTLLCKALSHAKESFVITEPMSLIIICQHYNMSTKHGRDIVHDTLLFYSWFANRHGAKTLLLKPHIMFLQPIYELFPNDLKKNIFIYRNPVAVAKSLRQRLPFAQRMLFHTVLKSVIRKVLLDIIPKDVKEYFYRDFPCPNANMNEIGTFIWWLFPFEEMVKILQHHAEECMIFSYEELIANPEENMKSLWNFFNFKHERLQNALEEFSQDSQRGTVLSRRRKNVLFEFEIRKIEQDVHRFLNHHYSYNQNYTLEKTEPLSLPYAEKLQ